MLAQHALYPGCVGSSPRGPSLHSNGHIVARGDVADGNIHLSRLTCHAIHQHR